MKGRIGQPGADRRTGREVRESPGDLRLVPPSEGASPDPADTLAQLTREERLAIIRGQDLLVDLAAQAELLRPDSRFYTDPRLVAWIDRELNSPERAHEGWSAERVRASAARIRSKVDAMRLRILPVEGAPPLEPAATAGTIPQVLGDASAAAAAPHLDLAAAAGVGRDLWDEPCDEWVRLPDDVPNGRYIALRVAGDSMSPVLHTGDTILVQLGPKVARGSVVLARLADGGYVVKRVARATRSLLQLASLNPSFPPVTVQRDEHTVVGTVVLRWCPHGPGNHAA